MGVTVQPDRLGQVQSLVRAFSILDALRESDEGMTLTEIAGASRLPRSTTHRLLATMNALRYVEFDPAGSRWMVGLQAFALGASFMKTRDVARLGRPIMRSLMIDAGETVNIGSASAEGLSYIAQLRPTHDQGAGIPTGAMMPLNTTASGKALLAFGSDNRIDAFLGSSALVHETEASCARPDALASELERIRRCGYAVDDQEHRIGLRCIAAPVFDSAGKARLALSISGSMVRLSDRRLPRLAHALTGAAARMSADIGVLLAA